MTHTPSKPLLPLLLVLVLLILDQIIKIEVKTTMYYGESIHIADWFYLRFVENPGMAFSMEVIPKAIQSIARIVFAAFIIWYIVLLTKANYKRGYIVCISLILAGAIGNIIDGTFYGLIFSESTPYQVSTFVPIGDGYAGWLHGKVVDMFYFPLFEFNWPGWMPFVGGENFVFFSPIFNLADAAVSCGMIALLLFYAKDFSHSITLVGEKLKSLRTSPPPPQN